MSVIFISYMNVQTFKRYKKALQARRLQRWLSNKQERYDRLEKEKNDRVESAVARQADNDQR